MEPSINLQLTEDQALIFFDWLVRVNQRGEVNVEDQAEERVLWDLESMLEKQLPVVLESDYDARLSAARDTLRDSNESP